MLNKHPTTLAALLVSLTLTVSIANAAPNPFLAPDPNPPTFKTICLKILTLGIYQQKRPEPPMNPTLRANMKRLSPAAQKALLGRTRRAPPAAQYTSSTTNDDLFYSFGYWWFPGNIWYGPMTYNWSNAASQIQSSHQQQGIQLPDPESIKTSDLAMPETYFTYVEKNGGDKPFEEQQASNPTWSTYSDDEGRRRRDQSNLYDTNRQDDTDHRSNESTDRSDNYDSGSTDSGGGDCGSCD